MKLHQGMKPPISDQTTENIDIKLLDIHSNTWQYVSRWAKHELSEARRKLEMLSVDECKTIGLRHRIKILKEILELERLTMQ